MLERLIILCRIDDPVLTCPPRSDPIVILGSDGGKLWEKEDLAPNRS